MVDEKTVEDVAVKLLQLAVTELPQDVKEALQRAYREEESEAGRTQLKAILDNMELAEKTRTPMCQDTGVIIFYVKAGAQAKGLDKVEDALRRATRRATKDRITRPLPQSSLLACALTRPHRTGRRPPLSHLPGNPASSPPLFTAQEG